MPSKAAQCNGCTVSLSIRVMRQEKIQALLSRAQFMETPLTGATLQVSFIRIA